MCRLCNHEGFQSCLNEVCVNAVSADLIPAVRASTNCNTALVALIKGRTAARIISLVPGRGSHGSLEFTGVSLRLFYPPLHPFAEM